MLGALSVVMMSGGLVLMTSGSAQATVNNTDNVTICHDPQGNGNTGNGYTIEPVDPFSIIKDSGHDSHNGDIIPTFTYNFDQGSNHYEGTYPGKNTDKASWIGNNCAAPTEPEACPEGSMRAGQPVGGQSCDKGPDVVKTTSAGTPDCTSGKVEQFETTTTTTYSFAEGAWHANAPTAVKASTGFRDATAGECPSNVQQPTLVSPNAPSQTEPTCTTAGSITAPAAQTGVVVTSTDLGNGTTRFVSVPAAGYTFGAGNAQTVSQTVTAKPRQSGSACGEVQGVDEGVGDPSTPVTPSTPSTPEPEVEGTSAGRTPAVKGTHVSRAPVVKGATAVRGTSAAVPNAVDAGLAGAPLTDVRVLVGQALLGGGLLLLAGAAWSGLGLRRRGDVPA